MSQGDSDKACEEASRWLAKLDRGLRQEEGSDLREWVKKAVNRKALVAAARLWHDPDVLAVLSQLFPISPELANPKPRPSVFKVALTCAAAVCIVAFAAVVLNGQKPWSYFDGSLIAPPAVIGAIYATARGERHEAKFADGTTITLNTGTRMAVTYSLHARDVNLLYGEASFDVAHDPQRPFNVRAGKRVFQALGTRFNVRMLTPEKVDLTVTEGAVKVLYAPPRLPETPSQLRDDTIIYGEATVGALEAALVEPGFQSVDKIDASELETRLAWQRGVLTVLPAH